MAGETSESVNAVWPVWLAAPATENVTKTSSKKESPEDERTRLQAEVEVSTTNIEEAIASAQQAEEAVHSSEAQDGVPWFVWLLLITIPAVILCVFLAVGCAWEAVWARQAHTLYLLFLAHLPLWATWLAKAQEHRKIKIHASMQLDGRDYPRPATAYRLTRCLPAGIEISDTRF